MKVLVTGGTGTVGLSLVEELVSHGLDTVVYALTPPPAAAWTELSSRGRLAFEQGDVRDSERLDDVLRREGVDAVIHAAAVTPDARTELESGAEVLSVNCVGSLNLVTAASRAGVRRIVHVSSVAAYGSSATTVEKLEEAVTPDQPESLYELSKYAAERAALFVGRARGSSVVSARVGDVFGRWEHPTAQRATMSAPYQIVDLARRGMSARLPRRGRKHWVYSIDVARALRLLAMAPTLEHDVYNVSSPFLWGVDDLCELAAKEFPEFEYSVVENPELGQSANVSLFRDNSPMAMSRITEVGYTAEYSMELAFQDYLGWIRDHPELTH